MMQVTGAAFQDRQAGPLTKQAPLNANPIVRRHNHHLPSKKNRGRRYGYMDKSLRELAHIPTA
ncbi:MAG: hypothetical protein ACR2RF_13560 [Geminicoccaceae bacterium]